MAEHKRLLEIGQDDRKVLQGTGRRTIGQVAGHEIHLKIEDVLDKKKAVAKNQNMETERKKGMIQVHKINKNAKN